MKIRKYHKGRKSSSDINKPEGEYGETFAGPSSEGIPEEVIGTKVLYNWLYQQEEEDYYSSVKTSDPLPDYMQEEALFVEY